MRKFKYVGEDDRDVPALGLTVKKGDVVDVENPDISAGLDGQADWEPIRAKKES